MELRHATRKQANGISKPLSCVKGLVWEKVGLKAVTREGMDFEFTLVFDLDIKHMATASKDRTGLFMDKPETLISPAMGQKIRKPLLKKDRRTF